MHLLILIALLLFYGCDAEVIKKSQVVPFVMGGSQLTFRINGIRTEEAVTLKCVIRFSDERDSIVVKPTLPLDLQSVICRLPPEVDSGSVVVDVVATSTGTVLVSEVVFIDSSPAAEVVVEENWDTNELSFSWDSEYFQQFFYPGQPIFLEVAMLAAESMEPVFRAEVFRQFIGLNSGISTFVLSNDIIDRISNIRYPYYYVLSPSSAPYFNMSSILFAPTLGMTDTEATRACGIWLEIAVAPTPDEINPCPPCLCQVELDDNFIKSEYDPQQLRLANGALDNHVLYYERVPTNGGHAQTCSYDSLTRNLATTSPAQASWVHAVSKYVSYQNNFFADIWPYSVCCLQSNSHQLCDLFHEKRPIDTGHQYPGPENPCSGFGDPHFATFNDVRYDFMGNGEFWLIRGPTGSEFGVQGRMSPIRDWQQVSYFNAIAIKDGNTTIQMELKNYQSFHLFLNGVEFPIPAHSTTLQIKNAHIIINGNIVNVRLRTGFSVIVDNNRNEFLNVYSSGAHRNKGKGFMGIFGNFGDDVQSDLTSQDGYVIPPTRDNLLNLSRIHYVFGLTWMTIANDSFFLYEDGKSWEDYANPNFGPILEYPDPATMPEEVRTICGDSRFCYYEYVGTASLEKAAGVVTIEQGLDELREEIKSVERPMCDVVRSPGNGRVQVNGYFNGSIANYSCNREYDFISGDRTRTCTASENESYWTGVEPACIWTCTTCDQNTEYQISHDPADCRQFFICFMGVRIPTGCPINHVFNPATLLCDEHYFCRDPPGC